MTKQRDHITPVLARLHWFPVTARIHFEFALLAFKALITNLSLNLPVKEFLKSVNIWRSYRQNG